MSQKKYLSSAVILCLIFLLCPPQLILSSEKHERSDFSGVSQAAETLARNYNGIDKVLLIYDVDNTLLRSTASLGSDQWYGWQASLLDQLSKEGPSPYLAAGDSKELLKIQGILFYLGSMIPPDPDAPGIVKKLQDSGYQSMVLTSRGSDYREMTLRELRRNGYEFKDHAPRLRSDRPFDPGPNASYADGVFMTAGQDKGRMLSLLLTSIQSEFKAIVFVDDGPKNVDRVLNMPDRDKYDICAIRYGREDNVVNDFKSNRDGVQDIVKVQWDKLKTAILNIWGRTGCPQLHLLPDSR